MRNKVLIYADNGCSDVRILKDSLCQYFEPRHCSVALTDANAIIRGNALNNEVLAFFMPGGASTPYRHKLQVLGNDKIREYVRNGGIYYGICAGAYYACTKTVFEEDIPELKIVAEYGLNLIDATAIGTLRKELNLVPYEKSAKASAVVELLGSNNEKYVAHYHGGPYFDMDDNSPNEILAEYNLENKKPAIVSCRFGLGRVVVSGVHFEDTAAAFAQIAEDMAVTPNSLQKILTGLKNEEPLRRALFDKLMSFCGR